MGSESRERSGLGRSASSRCAPLGKTGRNMCAERKTTVSAKSHVDFGGVSVSVRSAFIATNDAMRATDMQTSRLRNDDRPSERFRAVDRKTQHGRRVAGLACAGLDARLQIRQSDRNRNRSEALFSHLSEKGRRLQAAAEVRIVGRCGIKCLSEITGVARSTIDWGLREIGATSARWRPHAGDGNAAGAPGGPSDACRADDAGRVGAAVVVGLEELPSSCARPGGAGPISLPFACGAGFRTLGHTLRVNAKKRESDVYPDCDRHFAYIDGRLASFRAVGAPVTSVNIKKKEPVGIDDTRMKGTQRPTYGFL